MCPRPRRESRTGPGDVLVCDLACVPAADLGLVDALARLQLAAHRTGGTVRLTGMSPELRDLLAFVGLLDVLDGGRASRIEAGRKPEQR